MYAIVFELYNTLVPESCNTDIRTVLDKYEFVSHRGESVDAVARADLDDLDNVRQLVYFGGESVDAVACVLAVEELRDGYDWFAASVADMRMLRIEENTDLRPLIERPNAETIAAMEEARNHPPGEKSLTLKEFITVTLDQAAGVREGA